MVKRFGILMLAIGLQTAVPCNGEEQRDLSKAQQLYLSGQSTKALLIIESLLKSKPKDASAHYLKGHCLVKLNRLPEASHEYALVCHLEGQRSALGKSAATAHQDIEARQMQAARSIKPPSTGSTKLPPGTLELIRYQAAKAKERAIEAGQRDASDELKKADNQARNEHERVERLANEQGRNYALVHQQLEALRQRAAANAERIKQQGQAKSAMKELESIEKADNLERQAQDLEDQLVNDRQSRNGGMKLNPVGTNLYTRNYTKVPPSVKPLTAQTQCLPDATTFNTVSTKMHARHNPKVPHSSASNGHTETKVRGNVVRN